jgi:hypothetical protein
MPFALFSNACKPILEHFNVVDAIDSNILLSNLELDLFASHHF